ncbi:hypothetical protein [Ferruginibacter sp. SUN106]|uniref:hypothetical protein n=1 Tax=Ferruginibacter sp. SUN106 TaxID=2978348 RepID=UPI003D365F8C
MSIKSFCKKIVSLILFLSTCNGLFAQGRIDSLITQLGEKYPQEKIYLHFDKPYYNAGETIWFKAYMVTDNLATTLSKTVYAELIDDKGSILQKKIMPVYESGAASNFDLPDTLTNTRLFVRAYTSWMLNFDSSLIYLKPLQIIPATVAKKTNPAVAAYSITFFPEGGDMVETISSRVAFKANDQDGTPVYVSGNIVNETGKKIISFTAIHDGMGFFTITPIPGEKYKAVWKDKKGVTHETPLPVAKDQSVVLSIKNTNDTLRYTLKRPDSADGEFTAFTVVAQMQHQMVYSAKINMAVKKEVSAPIITANFPDGVLQLTIFNADQVPVAERLAFINHNNYYFATDLHAVESNLTRHGHNTLQVDVGDTILSNLSIAVTDASINPVGNNEESIFSNLLLTSDLKGYVYNPAYYFSSDEDSVKQHLDLVMMTNGWRRFKWDNLLAKQWPRLVFPIDNYLSVKGSIYGLSKTQLTNKELIGYIKTKSNTSNFITIPLSTDGQFRLTGMYFFDTAKLYYQINNDKDKRLTAIASFNFKNEIANAPAPAAGLLSTLFLNIKPDSSSFLKNIKQAALQRSLFESKAKTLEVVKVVGKVKSLKEKLEEQYTSGFFSGGDGYTFTTQDDPFAQSATSVLEYLRGKVAGMQVSADGQSVSWRGSATSIFLNETNSDISQLQTINMTDVALIKVFRPPFFGASGGGAGGAIAIYTKKGGGDNSAVKGLDFTNIYGYSAIKEFYMPDYEKPNTPDVPDYRSTIYWNPFLIMDRKTRRIKIPFYNTDNCKKIRVIIEGINKLGQLTREEKIFE